MTACHDRFIYSKSKICSDEDLLTEYILISDLFYSIFILQYFWIIYQQYTDFILHLFICWYIESENVYCLLQAKLVNVK